MPDETNEEFVVTKGVTEIFLVSAKDAAEAEDAVTKGLSVLVQRRTSMNSQPKPADPTPTETTGATHAALQTATKRLSTAPSKLSG